MRRLLKFLHTLGAIGMMGAMAAFLVGLCLTPAPATPAAQAAVIAAMARVGTWVFLPSLALTLIGGLLAMAVNPGFHDVGWAWVKLATGVLVFEGGLVSVLGPIQAASKVSARVLAGQADPALLGKAFGAEQTALWVLLGVALANVVLGVWRPRLSIPV